MYPYNFQISFRIFHPTMDPLSISKQLKLTPTRHWLSGTQRKTPKGLTLEGVYDSSYCLFTVKKNKGDMIDSIQSFLKTLEKHKKLLNQIVKTGGRSELYLSIFCDKNSGEVFDWNLLGSFAVLQVDLALDIYPSTN